MAAALSPDGASLRVVVSDAGNSAIRLLQFPVTSPPATRAAGAALAGEGTVGDFLGAPVAGGEARLPTAAAGGLEVDWEAGTVATLVPKETAFGWLGAPQGVACSAGCREVAIADSGNNRVLRAHIPDRIATAPGAHANVTAVQGVALELVAGPATLGWEKAGYVDGNATEARFAYPTGVSLSPDGDEIHVVDHQNHVVRRIATEPEAAVETAAGTGAPGDVDSVDVFGMPERFSWPSSVAALRGSLFVGDTFNHKVRWVSEAGGVFSVAGGYPGLQDGAAMPTSSANKGLFNEPQGVALVEHPENGTVSVYVADRKNCRLAAVTLRMPTTAHGAAG